MTPSQPEPLTCETALERLDTAWLDPLPEEPLGADLLAAREHLQECSACWTKWEERRVADRRIAEVMQAIPVPTGLREQLLAQTVADNSKSSALSAAGVFVDQLLAQNVVAASTDQPTVATRTRHDRQLKRRAWWISVAAMLLVSFAGGSWLWQTLQPRRVSMQMLCDHTPLTPAGLTKVVDFSKLPPLPATWPRVKGLRVPEPTCWFTPPSTRDAAGWFIFELKTGRAPAIRGVLLVIRQANVSDPPAELIARPSWSGYTQRGGKPVSVAGWSERGVVFLCFVPGEPDALDRVLSATTPTSA